MQAMEDFFKALRIPAASYLEYIDTLKRLGYDDIQSLKEDVSISDFSNIGMKPGHAKRIYKALHFDSLDDSTASSPIKFDHVNSKRVDISPIMSSDPYFQTGGFCIGPIGIESIPKDLSSSQKESNEVHRFTKEATILLEEIGRGGSGVVMNGLYLPTMTFVAVSKQNCDYDKFEY